MRVELTRDIFQKLKNSVVMGIFLNYFDQDIRGVPAILFTLTKNMEPLKLEVWNVQRFLSNCDCSTQKWIKDVIYEGDGKIRIRMYTIEQFIEYDEITYSEIICIGNDIELKLIEKNSKGGDL